MKMINIIIKCFVIYGFPMESSLFFTNCKRSLLLSVIGNDQKDEEEVISSLETAPQG